jgi:hypothetical protein
VQGNQIGPGDPIQPAKLGSHPWNDEARCLPQGVWTHSGYGPTPLQLRHLPKASKGGGKNLEARENNERERDRQTETLLTLDQR